MKDNESLRLMLVELLPDEAERQFGMQDYPFLMGLARSLGWEVSWSVLGVRYDPTLRYALDPGDIKLLLAEAGRRRPQVVVLNERLREDQAAALAAAAGEARLVYSSRRGDQDLSRFADFVREHLPEAPRRVVDDPDLLDRIEPEFKREVLNKASWADNPIVRVFVGNRCSYRTRVADNPYYRRLKLPSATMRCSFCFDEGVASRVSVRRQASLAARQVATACRLRPAAGGERRFEVIGSRLRLRLEGFVRELLRLGARSAELCFMPRIDEILEARAVIERCLPLLARNDLAIRFYGAGVENFSSAENLRLNKGITARQVHEAAAFIIATRARWPEQFRFQDGQLSMILFTPWTTLDDLRINMENIERCPLICPCAALKSRLQLFPGPGRPIAALAEHDGLLDKKRDVPFYNSGCIVSADQSEIPWRFAHPEVEVLCRLGLKISRYHRDERPADDPEIQAIGAFARKEAGPPNPLPLFRRAIDVVERHPRIGSPLQLLELMRKEGIPAGRRSS